MTLRRPVSYAKGELFVVLAESHGCDEPVEWNFGGTVCVFLLDFVDISKRHLLLPTSSSSCPDGIVFLTFELLLL